MTRLSRVLAVTAALAFAAAASTYVNAMQGPVLVGHWTFDNPQQHDLTGNWSSLTLGGNASIGGGSLAVTGNGPQTTGFARADGYTGPTIGDKTLIAWVTLDNHGAWAGSPLGLNKHEGFVFDSIVWGEIGHTWIAGSDFFFRTQNVNAVDTTPGTKRQIAIAYKSLGNGAQTITMCVDGNASPSYTTGIATFDKSENPFVLFGPRHTFGFQGGSLAGALNAHIDEARLYAGAMTCAEAAALEPVVPDTTAPVITPTVTGTLGAGGWYVSNVTVSWDVADDESDATFSCPSQTVTTDTNGTTLSCSASSEGGTATQTVTIKRDTTAPAIVSVTATPGTLWSPNHKMSPVTVSASATDAGASGVVCAVQGVAVNEGTNQHEPDIELTGAMTLNLRAEREGSGPGRVYTIQVSCRDAVGNTATRSTPVTVAHDQGKKK